MLDALVFSSRQMSIQKGGLSPTPVCISASLQYYFPPSTQGPLDGSVGTACAARVGVQTWPACCGPGTSDIGSAPALESQELNSFLKITGLFVGWLLNVPATG